LVERGGVGVGEKKILDDNSMVVSSGFPIGGEPHGVECG
jgi:hypothetical protein